MWGKAGTVLILLTFQWSACAQEFDVAGIRLGMPLKEAMAALKQHNPNMRLKPESLQYPGLPNALTYAISAEGASEVFYFLITMPPSEPAISKISWTAKFTNENPPRQDDLVATLAKKYGTLTWDTLPASLSLGSRELVWADDPNGKRLKGELPGKCRGVTTFFTNRAGPSGKQYDPMSLQLSNLLARRRVEQGYKNATDLTAEECAAYTMVRARLFQMKLYGVAGPQLVGYMTLMAGSGPLDRTATNATHEYFLKTVKPRQ